MSLINDKIFKKFESHYLTKFGVSPLNGGVTQINDYYIEVFLIITSKLDSVAAEVLNTLSLITRPANNRLSSILA